MKQKSRAEYYRKRRGEIGQFSVPVPRYKLEMLTKKLTADGKTKTAWLAEKIDEEISKTHES